MEPWSVSPTAGISNSAARAASDGMRQAPSRIEYSEWTWRWANGASGTGTHSLEVPVVAPPGRRLRLPSAASGTILDVALDRTMHGRHCVGGRVDWRW